MKTIIIFLFINSALLAQIDTTDYFPMQTGNYWEYWGNPAFFFDLVKMTVEVRGDTLLANNKNYKIFQRNIYYDTLGNYSSYYSYFRKDSNKIYINDNDSLEYIYYDFSKPDSSIWPIHPTYYANYRGVHTSISIYIPMANIVTEVRIFDFVNVNNGDTVWAPMSSPMTEYIARGIGLISEMDWDFAYFKLYGMKINGEIYGQITSVIDEKQSKRNFVLFQNHPNPFNPSTIISYSIPKRSHVTIKVFDLLGRQVAELVNEDKPAGNYNVTFDGSKLSSGVYFYSITAGSVRQTKKMMLVK